MSNKFCMNESEIVIPVSSIKRKSEDVDLGMNPLVSKIDKRKVEVSLSKFLKLLSNHELDYLMQKYSSSHILLNADLLLDLTNLEPQADDQPQSVSFLALGLLGALFLGFLILLIYLV